MTKKEISDKLFNLMETYIDLIKYAKENYDHDLQLTYENKLSAVETTAYSLLGSKMADALSIRKMRLTGQIRPTNK
jgi:hypothetical protein